MYQAQCTTLLLMLPQASAAKTFLTAETHDSEPMDTCNSKADWLLMHQGMCQLQAARCKLLQMFLREVGERYQVQAHDVLSSVLGMNSLIIETVKDTCRGSGAGLQYAALTVTCCSHMPAALPR
jgi:hypothetical protein